VNECEDSETGFEEAYRVDNKWVSFERILGQIEERVWEDNDWEEKWKDGKDLLLWSIPPQESS